MAVFFFPVRFGEFEKIQWEIKLYGLLFGQPDSNPFRLFTKGVFATKLLGTLPVKMFGTFGSVWSKTALAEVGVSLP